MGDSAAAPGTGVGGADLSICMVSLNCWAVLEPCLESLLRIQPDLCYEVIMVDNASSDGTPEKLQKQYPWVTLVRNDRNVGFTKANNQAILESRGRLILWLNTDTLLEPDSLAALCAFLETHPGAGIVGPKVLNADGSFQPQCRRGLPTPFASLCYFLGLDRRWPGNRSVSQYLLRFLPEDVPNQVDAVSGCCLLARREVWDQIGPLDEEIFGFGEDVDWCVRARDAGWEVWYAPSSRIVHLKGQGGVHSKPFHKVWGIHQAMWVFYRKHLRPKYPWPVTALVASGVGFSLVLSMGRESLRAAVRRVRRSGP